MGQEIMHIAFCTNAHYGPYTGVAMNSMILNNIGEKMVFHILHSGLREDDMAKFKATEKLYRDVTVKFYHVTGDDKMASYRTTYHFTKEMFYRWLIPYVVDRNIQNVFYSDGDVICVGSLRELFNLKFAEETPYALASPGQIDKGFSCGNMLMNLPKWREQKITERCFATMDDHGKDFDMPDADCIGEVVGKNFYALSNRWCYGVDCSRHIDPCIPSDIAIVHFLGSTKPWLSWCPSANKDVWWDYAKRSLWHDLKPVPPQNWQTAIWTAEAEARRGDLSGALKNYRLATQNLIQTAQAIKQVKA